MTLLIDIIDEYILYTVTNTYYSMTYTMEDLEKKKKKKNLRINCNNSTCF